MEDNNPIQLSCNRVQFIVPGNSPGCITITAAADSMPTFFHVIIEFPTEEKALEVCKEVCPSIREYSQSIPQAELQQFHSRSSLSLFKAW